ncbi:hypothetical protein HQ865_16855 [Mucilaginibacter mali]|uniref:Uncharacterized protein n=1 Tax=Mucilaginibacter mali TaxID=2740462 RepID=A0A7D4UPX4_9SPHI|nr:DUF6702 family protein [Mucilaginibacter mali]QKJ31360.1 hypothetical protein HQ865_16855 [Mucilaginibacter mali]
MAAIFYQTLLYCYILSGTIVHKPAPATKALHPLHVSTTEISYNAQNGHLEVICTIFTDDFESTLGKQYHTHTDLVKPDMHKAMDALIKQYLATNLHLKNNGTDAPLSYVGYEINREAANVYLETDKVTLPKKVDVNVSLLQDLYNDQINIVHISVNGVRKSAKLEYPNKVVGQSF